MFDLKSSWVATLTDPSMVTVTITDADPAKVEAEDEAFQYQVKLEVYEDAEKTEKLGTLNVTVGAPATDDGAQPLTAMLTATAGLPENLMEPELVLSLLDAAARSTRLAATTFLAKQHALGLTALVPLVDGPTTTELLATFLNDIEEVISLVKFNVDLQEKHRALGLSFPFRFRTPEDHLREALNLAVNKFFPQPEPTTEEPASEVSN